jgi:hypothetical protein
MSLSTRLVRLLSFSQDHKAFCAFYASYALGFIFRNQGPLLKVFCGADTHALPQYFASKVSHFFGRAHCRNFLHTDWRDPETVECALRNKHLYQEEFSGLETEARAWFKDLKNHPVYGHGHGHGVFIYVAVSRAALLYSVEQRHQYCDS